MSTYSGAATLLGWVGHELQWRGPIPELGRRQQDLDQIYRGSDQDPMRSALARYGARFVVVGDFERTQYGPGLEQRFESWPVAFRSGAITIYRAPPA
jgi:uncharacterized membrane protein